MHRGCTAQDSVALLVSMPNLEIASMIGERPQELSQDQTRHRKPQLKLADEPATITLASLESLRLSMCDCSLVRLRLPALTELALGWHHD